VGKITILRQKIIFFPIVSPGSAPALVHTEFEQLSSAVMKSDSYQGERWGGDMVSILSLSTYFDALVKQLKIQEYTFLSLYMINSAKRPTSP
jgi:hypothetical protein